MKPKQHKVHSQKAWTISSSRVELSMTETGAHMAPVVFFRDQDPVNPYYISPWQDEKLAIDDPVLVPLRGDFFCMPFGANSAALKNEKHVCHGQPATEPWTLSSYRRAGGLTMLELSMTTSIRPGRITKTVSLLDGHDVVYTRHLLEGYNGQTSLGHHATLDPLGEEDSMLISTSPILYGMISSGPHAKGGEEYHSLRTGARFKRLDRVPTVWKDEPWTDCSVYPRRRGFGDIMQVYNKPGSKPAWVAAVYPDHGFLWFSLKDTAVLPSTLFWMENGGRHLSPWKGRTRCIGLEDVCGYFAQGIVPSVRENEINRAGIPTAVTLSPRTPFAVNYIQGAARIPKGFDRVKSVHFKSSSLVFVSDSGETAETPVHHRFVYTGEPG